MQSAGIGYCKVSLCYLYYCITCISLYYLLLRFLSRYHYTLLFIFENLSQNINNLHNERTCIWLQLLPISVVEGMIKNSLAYIRKFLESDDEIRVMCNIGDIVCWMWDVGVVECSRCEIFGRWDVGDMGCWDVGCSECAMFGMWDVWDVGYLRCGMFRMWNVQVAVCSGCEMFRLRYVWDVVCLGCGMFGMWNVRDVGFSEYGIFGMWDVGCFPECEMLIYKIPIFPQFLNFLTWWN